VRGQCSSWLSHLTLFVLKNIHLSSSYVPHSPTTNGLGLTDDDTKTLPMIGNFLNASSKALSRTPNSKSSCVTTRDLAEFNASLVSVLVGRVVFLYPHRGASRWFQASRLSRRGRSLPRTISHCGSGRGDTSHQSSGTSPSVPLPTPHASPHRSPLPLPLSPWSMMPSSVAAATDRRHAEGHSEENVKGNEGCVWSEMQVFQGPNHPDLVRPISIPLPFPTSLPLPPLPLDTCARTRALFIGCRLSCSLFPVGTPQQRASFEPCSAQTPHVASPQSRCLPTRGLRAS